LKDCISTLVDTQLKIKMGVFKYKIIKKKYTINYTFLKKLYAKLLTYKTKKVLLNDILLSK